MSWSEDSLHRWLFERHGADPVEGLAGAAGSDAAVLAAHLTRPVLCTDQVVEGRHFTRAAAPRAVGHKAAARALSDLAATAATPRALLCALRAPDDEDEARLRAMLEGLWATGRRCGAPLVGGDISAGDGPTSLAVTALGELPGDRPPPGRERAREGDVVLVTGPLGGSLLGRHLTFEPRLAAGRWLHAGGAGVLMDVSDGLARDLGRIASRSGRALQLELECVPLHPDAERRARTSGRTPLQHALEDGEDHELLACVPPDDAERLLADRQQGAPQLTRIGQVVAGDGVWVRASASESWRRLDDPGGYLHGGDAPGAGSARSEA